MARVSIADLLPDPYSYTKWINFSKCSQKSPFSQLLAVSSNRMKTSKQMLTCVHCAVHTPLTQHYSKLHDACSYHEMKYVRAT
jgi:hypothetical protein